jgi:glycyl-tRNA synthetase beta chain
MTTQNLLVELFVEELPPKALNKLGAAFSGVLAEQLKAQGLAAADAVVTAFASPRRLTAHVTGVLAQGADKAVQQKLMPVAVGLDANAHISTVAVYQQSDWGSGTVPTPPPATGDLRNIEALLARVVLRLDEIAVERLGLPAH